MMPQPAPTARVCRDCDGFSRVAITNGTRKSDGTRATLTVACPACKGTGRTVPAPALHRAGW
jgi:DnaJ-class molecular chaperone